VGVGGGGGGGGGEYIGTENNSHSSRLLTIKLILPSVFVLHRGGVIFQIDGCHSNERQDHKYLGCVSAYQTTWFHVVFVFHCSVVKGSDLQIKIGLSEEAGRPPIFSTVIYCLTRTTPVSNVYGTLPPGVGWPELEAGHSPPFSACAFMV